MTSTMTSSLDKYRCMYRCIIILENSIFCWKQYLHHRMNLNIKNYPILLLTEPSFLGCDRSSRKLGTVIYFHDVQLKEDNDDHTLVDVLQTCILSVLGKSVKEDSSDQITFFYLSTDKVL
ncbi:hypothetical protein TNCV_3015581 [Trichonephila clavipes]|nr:hypothetical protein TNCV_3015581 [Trichonephila clavipes]